jgi:CRISPR system Cascade subunit CasB
MTKKETVGSFVSSRIAMLQNGTPWAKAQLAKLRRCVNKPLEESQDCWEFIFSGIPDELVSRTKSSEPSPSENAVLTALTLYATHQQGSSASVNTPNVRFGSAANMLVDQKNADAIKRRFDTIVTSQDLSELSVHVRSLIQLMKSSDRPIGFDYRLFAMDLYDFQFDDSRSNVQKRWAVDFYKKNVLKDEKE